MSKIRKRAERMVMAYDEGGQRVLALASETVSVPACPVSIDADGAPLTPRLARALMMEEPHGLISVEKDARAGRPCLRVVLKCTPFVRCVLDGKKHMGERTTVCVFDAQDARDPYFATLPEADRALILSRLTTH